MDRPCLEDQPCMMGTPPSLNISIYRVQNFAHNISIPMEEELVGGWRVGG
jgi:hypothetical protein